MSFTSLRVAERLCGKYPGADTVLLAIFGGKFPAVFFFVEEREREFFAQILNLFFSKHTYMASTNDIARLLNVDHRDSSAFADVIAEYFDDREADVYSSSDSEDGSGM